MFIGTGSRALTTAGGFASLSPYITLQSVDLSAIHSMQASGQEKELDRGLGWNKLLNGLEPLIASLIIA